jgi:hypothetical protein
MQLPILVILLATFLCLFVKALDATLEVNMSGHMTGLSTKVRYMKFFTFAAVLFW